MKNLLKKLKTNKGFSLVECIIAIAIFAIMSTMLVLIMQAAISREKQATNVNYDVNQQMKEINSASGYDISKVEKQQQIGTLNDIRFKYDATTNGTKLVPLDYKMDKVRGGLVKVNDVAETTFESTHGFTHQIENQLTVPYINSNTEMLFINNFYTRDIKEGSGLTAKHYSDNINNHVSKGVFDDSSDNSHHFSSLDNILADNSNLDANPSNFTKWKVTPSAGTLTMQISNTTPTGKTPYVMGYTLPAGVTPTKIDVIRHDEIFNNVQAKILSVTTSTGATRYFVRISGLPLLGSRTITNGFDVILNYTGTNINQSYYEPGSGIRAPRPNYNYNVVKAIDPTTGTVDTTKSTTFKWQDTDETSSSSSGTVDLYIKIVEHRNKYKPNGANALPGLRSYVDSNGKIISTYSRSNLKGVVNHAF